MQAGKKSKSFHKFQNHLRNQARSKIAADSGEVQAQSKMSGFQWHPCSGFGLRAFGIGIGTFGFFAAYCRLGPLQCSNDNVGVLPSANY